MPSDDKTGYGNPPKHTRFKPGQSGNPKGRPKGTKNLETDLEEEMRELIVVREGGNVKTVSKQRAMLKSLTANAVHGDSRAADIVINMMYRLLHEDDADDASRGPSPDDKVRPSILRWLQEYHTSADSDFIFTRLLPGRPA